MNLLIAFASVEGQTAKIARFISTIASKCGYKAHLLNTDEQASPRQIDDFHRTILVAPVHERRHPKSFETFLKTHSDALVAQKTLMLSVSLKAAFASGHEEAADYLAEMLLRTQFQPNKTALIAGAVRPEAYGYFEKEIVRHVVLLGQKVNPNEGPREFTDWDQLSAIVTDFLSGS